MLCLSFLFVRLLKIDDLFYFFFFVNNFRVNQLMFSGSSNVDTLASGKDVVNVKLPSVSSTEGMEFEDREEDHSNVPESKALSGFQISSQQIPDLITLSLLPRSQWQSLINLDIIKVSFYLMPPTI